VNWKGEAERRKKRIGSKEGWNRGSRRGEKGV
jgi:hypothetical protein